MPGHAPSGDPDTLASTLSDVARSLERQDDPSMTLIEIVRAAVELIPGCDEGSISVVVGRRKVDSHAASGELPRVVDAIQSEVGQGPCLDAVYSDVPVLATNMAAEERWPLFASRACAAGAAGMLSFRLYVAGENLGALNLLSRTAGMLDEESVHIGLLFASHAAVAYASAQKVAKLEGRVATRQLIGQAQGILMERHKVTSERAFELMVVASQRRNEKLRDVAEHLAREGKW